MANCPKCSAANDDDATRCQSCKAILPVKLGSKSNTRWERVRREPELVGMNCPKCGTTNPYTRFRCKSCNALLSKTETKSGITKYLVYACVGIAVIAVLMVVLRGI